jgi:dihydrofolate synthase/folylpolyglutamate synthase
MFLPSWPNPNNMHHIDLTLDRVKLLLERLNNPHHHLPPTIHIAGTNGKGSTTAFLKSIFNQAGYKVHRYTSPHLVNFNERIELCDEIIGDDFLNEILNEVKLASEIKPEIPVTFFEGTTIAAFLAFSRIKTDILILETGMGGEFDATNVIDNPLCSIITTIDFDHQQYLGENLSKIASAKAGIIKKNCLTITTNQTQEVIKVIEDKTKLLNSNLIIAPEFIAKNFSNLSNLELGLKGVHQQENASLAIAFSLIQTSFKFNNQQIIEGLRIANWKARLQEIFDQKILNLLPKNSQLFLDGSHNLQGAKTVKNFLNYFANKKITIIFSMLNDKNCFEFLNEITTCQNYQIAEIIFIEMINQPRAMSFSDFSEIAKKLKINYKILNNFSDAFNYIKETQTSLTLITGSLFFASQFLKDFDNFN